MVNKVTFVGFKRTIAPVNSCWIHPSGWLEHEHKKLYPSHMDRHGRKAFISSVSLHVHQLDYLTFIVVLYRESIFFSGFYQFAEQHWSSLLHVPYNFISFILLTKFKNQLLCFLRSVAIMRYLASKFKEDKLYPSNIQARAKVDEYLAWQHLNTRFVPVHVHAYFVLVCSYWVCSDVLFIADVYTQYPDTNRYSTFFVNKRIFDTNKIV